jgi:hypothetical protein
MLGSSPTPYSPTKEHSQLKKNRQKIKDSKTCFFPARKQGTRLSQQKFNKKFNKNSTKKIHQKPKFTTTDKSHSKQAQSPTKKKEK